ncbi:hypothetical protein PG993_005627 [Apiospora rasikravindrae]|uniref:Uncharacterized protein n=1 Tax=Apiospora rasikravindrae TaxID=990691 RepID=A0ABR1TIV5_9PEZI
MEGISDPAITQKPLFCRDQDAPRTYTEVMLCFPVEGDPTHALNHLKGSVTFLENNYPLFTARLVPSPNDDSGRLHLSTSSVKGVYDLPFVGSTRFYNEDGTFIKYDALRDAGFPVSELSVIFARDDAAVRIHTQPLSVALVHGVALDRGLLVRILVHHALFDGHMRSHFIDCLAAATRGQTRLKSPTKTSFPFDYDHNQSFRKRLSGCPELVLFPHPMPSPRLSNMVHGGYPHEGIPKTSKVFVFSEAKVKELQELLYRHSASSPPPGSSAAGEGKENKAAVLSTYVCISALTFAHVVRARLRGEGFQYLSQTAHASSAVLRHEVDFRRRAFISQNLAETYFGNATVSVFTRVSQALVLAAAGAMGQLGGVAFPLRDKVDVDGSGKAEKLAGLAREIKGSLDAVDEDYVRARLAVAETVSDPRRLGLDYDPRQPQVLGFNSWRYTGGSEPWGFPSSTSSSSSSSGEQGQRPEAFRVARGYSMHNALILPQRHGSRDQEVLVSLSQVAMGELLKDVGWMKWVRETRD